MKNKFIPILFILLLILTMRRAECQEWTQIDAQFDPPGQYHIDYAKFTDKNNGWWVSHYPSLLFRTTDGCKTFVSQTIDDSLNFACLDFFDANNGWVVAKKISNNQLYLYRTRNAGNSWTKTALSKSLFPIKFLDTLNGIGGIEIAGQYIGQMTEALHGCLQNYRIQIDLNCINVYSQERRKALQ